MLAHAKDIDVANQNNLIIIGGVEDGILGYIPRAVLVPFVEE